MKLNSTQEVDVYGSVLRARSQNPAFIKKTVSRAGNIESSSVLKTVTRSILLDENSNGWLMKI